jgi:hypothetical protein
MILVVPPKSAKNDEQKNLTIWIDSGVTTKKWQG